MTIEKKLNGTTLTVRLVGLLDTNAAPILEGELRTSTDGITALIFDFSQLTYLTSAGIRVLVSAQKVMNRRGIMEIHDVIPEIMDIFDMTGLTDVFTIVNE